MIAEAVFLCYVLAGVDGDTFKVRCPLWPGIEAVDALRVRNLDTPETNHLAKCANERTLGLEAKALAGQVEEVFIRNVARDKYGRLLADVTVRKSSIPGIEGKDWASFLVEKKLAIPYDGGTKTNPWCKLPS